MFCFGVSLFRCFVSLFRGLVMSKIVNKLNQLLFKFLWKGTDKVTHVSIINDYENGGLKTIHLESMVKPLKCI